ncbi:MAG: cytochrome P450 [Gemmataceae bacterium]|nr:cytochrome P450 [Gemmataceae bacterium]
MPTDPREGDEFVLAVPAKLDDPFPDLAYLREHRPVFFYPPLNSWFVFPYDPVHDLLQDPRLSSDRMRGFVDAAPADARPGVRTMVPYLETWMLMKDGADHARVRGHLQKGLTPAVVKRLAGPIRAAADALLDAAMPRGRLDAAGEYAFLLPAYVLSDLFGVPPADRPRLIAWSLAFVGFFNVLPITTQTAGDFVRSGTEMVAYARDLLANRRAAGGGDFLAAVAADGGLTDDEVAGNVMLLLLAGHLAVRNLVGNALWLLLTRPDQFARVKADPGLIPAAVEETLRFEPPVTLIPRVALEDVTVGGQSIKAGQVVQLSLAAANRDPAHFPDPDRFDLGRAAGHHLSFGAGVHGCFGAALAREVATIALETLIRRAPGLRLDPAGKIAWYRNAANRGPSVLPVTWGGAPGPG